jgi:hypothetical protein
MAKTSRPLSTQTQLKNTSHKIDPLDSKRNSPGKKGASRRTKKKNEEVRAKIRDIKKNMYTRWVENPKGRLRQKRVSRWIENPKGRSTQKLGNKRITAIWVHPCYITVSFNPAIFEGKRSTNHPLQKARWAERLEDIRAIAESKLGGTPFPHCH